MNENVRVCVRQWVDVGVDVGVDVVGGVYSDRNIRNKQKHTTNTMPFA